MYYYNQEKARNPGKEARALLEVTLEMTMNEFTTFTPNTSRRADYRKFDVLTVDRKCGVVVDVPTNTVTLTRTAAGLVAEIDGQAATVESAVRLLAQAQRVSLLEEVLTAPTPVVAVIGKAVACELHRELGRLGYRTSASHYGVAATALGRDVTSLAALTAEEAQLTRSFAYGRLGLPTGSAAA
ncbi:hypothetical protein [Deinococcus alpinitundrae]|uniref:hypothetical protein n=1 Tax=Deinococcus alpinitundrae TaxID=468913 RepID=UPI001ED9409D|nr:hypothetical protein [Deinococcus alpinitundrae]